MLQCNPLGGEEELSGVLSHFHILYLRESSDFRQNYMNKSKERLASYCDPKIKNCIKGANSLFVFFLDSRKKKIFFMFYS